MAESEQPIATKPIINQVPEYTQRYFGLMGRLFAIYPGIEMALFNLLGLLSGVDIEICRALFSDSRTGDMKDAINRVLVARAKLSGETDLYKFLKDEIPYVLTQLAHINTIRNNVTHYGVHGLDEEKPVVTNHLKGRASNLVNYSVGPDDLESMIHDIDTAFNILSWHSLIIMGSPMSRTESIGHYKAFRAQRPWLYKSPLQGGAAKSQKTSQGPKSPPQSSPA